MRNASQFFILHSLSRATSLRLTFLLVPDIRHLNRGFYKIKLNPYLISSWAVGYSLISAIGPLVYRPLFVKHSSSPPTLTMIR